jgi:hypothetical protein
LIFEATEIAAANRMKKKKNQKEKTTQRPSLHTRSAGYILQLGRDGSAVFQSNPRFL